MDDATPEQPKRKPRDRAQYMRDYRARTEQTKRKATRKPHGAGAVRANDKTPFDYDAKPVIAKHIGPGRPTGYHPLRGDELVALMAEGLCLTAAAGAMGFCYETLNEWSHRYPEFSQAIKRGRAVQTLYLNRKLNLSVDGPAVTAAIFALKSACPQEWRDRQEHVTQTAPDDPVLAFLKSINGKVLRPVEPPTIEGACQDVTQDETPVTQPPRIGGPPRPYGGPQQ